MYILKDKFNREEIVVKKSRFIASIFYVENEEDVKNNIKNLKKEFFDARHHVYAYIIGKNIKQSDDGEPTGCGGKPILNILETNNMDKCLIVVSRIFGGVLLGTGGLSRAYGDAAKLVHDKVEKLEVINGYKIDIKFEYNFLSMIKKYISHVKNSKIENIEYGDIIYMSFYIQNEYLDDVINNLNNITSGNIDIVDKKDLDYTI